ncbi:S41 family peptidase [Chryseosolibacter indicus]|uniref:S41 family peptidase n=1 Tax=Chryseosolibacter indicus TaxID=2782351 RepID=A0ABS5VTH2_9BACT|nr:S41 family peptidase [Chryseosolibacter indicus]MBT1704715.1 S41 family peptidase [Chryseosolibacter indicus]
MRKKVLFPFIVIACIVALSFTKPADRYFEIAKNLDIFATLFKEVNALYVDEVNPNKLIRTGIDAMLGSLDPYTNYIAEDEVEDYRTVNTGQYGGIGAITREIGGKTIVTMIMDGYGAQKGGLKIGDEVLEIDGVQLSKLSREESGQLMKGQVGTPVTLTIKRYGSEQPIKLQFKREKIKVHNVPYSGMLSNDIAYIQLSDFTPDAGKEVRNSLIALKEKGAKGVILDLRGNPGGLLIEAVNISNIFIPKGKLVVSTKGKIPENNLSYETLNAPVDTEIPVAVLINRGSASASEIVAGTLQDYDRGVVLGERSYGKGLVQVSRPLSYNSQLKVTTAKYYTPTGRCIQVLDYAHRRDDGSVASIPDSIKRSFKTSTGRTVYDGGGIEPDIKVEAVEASALTQVLFEKGFLFDFATQYVYKNPEVVDPKTFSLSDEGYQQFVTWMKGKDYSYKSYLEHELEELTGEAKKEKYYGEIKNQLEQVKTRIAENKKNELMLYKNQVKMLLEEEIIARFHLEKGSVEAGFKYDNEVKKAIEVLHDTQQYKKVLNIQ